MSEARTLIDHQMAALRRFGITDVIVVVGYCGDQIRRHLGDRVRYVDNERYEHTNSLYSLWLAREELESGALILNSDVLALPLLFDRLLQSPAPDAILVERGDAFEPEDMKVMLNGSQVVDFGKDLPPERAHAHNVGVAKFSGEGASRLVDCLEHLVATGPRERLGAGGVSGVREPLAADRRGHRRTAVDRDRLRRGPHARTSRDRTGHPGARRVRSGAMTPGGPSGTGSPWLRGWLVPCWARPVSDCSSI